uniref:thiol oxidase n=1 Tax=viral metagenome TaxID=1070528 RepID=A0A6C0JKQ8_9ZZZZ
MNIEVTANTELIKEIHWGVYTWRLFHTLSNKIKTEKFLDLKSDLVKHIELICVNLFCKTCKYHAIKYIKENPFENINSKEDLKIQLYNFHNTVTQERNKFYKQYKPDRTLIPMFIFENLDNEYNIKITIDVIEDFLKRDFIIENNEVYISFKEWIYNNISSFEK